MGWSSLSFKNNNISIVSWKDDIIQNMPITKDSVSSVRYDFPPPMPREWTSKEIDDELRDNGVKKDLASMGYFIENMMDMEMEMTPRIARGRFIINEKFTEPNGQLIRGIVDYIAEGIASAAGSLKGPAVGIELNRSYLRPAYLGQEVTVIAKPLRKSSSSQVWEIKFEAESMKKSPTESNADELEKVLFAVARLTLMVQTLGGKEKLAVRSKL